jgi:hypothetical protein
VGISSTGPPRRPTPTPLDLVNFVLLILVYWDVPGGHLGLVISIEGQISLMCLRTDHLKRIAEATNMKKKSDDTDGLIVFIGPARRRPPNRVLVGWTPDGEEHTLLDSVNEFAQDKMLLLLTVSASKRDVEWFKARRGKSWSYGYWFNRSAEVRGAIAKLFRNEYRMSQEVLSKLCPADREELVQAYRTDHEALRSA